MDYDLQPFHQRQSQMTNSGFRDYCGLYYREVYFDCWDKAKLSWAVDRV